MTEKETFTVKHRQNMFMIVIGIIVIVAVAAMILRDGSGDAGAHFRKISDRVKQDLSR